MQIKPYQAEAFINNIANNKEIFAAVLYGPESGLIQIRAKKIATSIVPDLSDPFLVVSLNDKQFDEDKGLLADEFAAISMLGGRKLILVDGGNKTTESLKMIFEAPKKAKKLDEQDDFKCSPYLGGSSFVADKTMGVHFAGDNFILITAGELDKSSSLRKFAETSPYIAAIACYEDDENVLSGIINQKLRELNFVFSNDVPKILVEKFGKNRQIILNEIEKLDLALGTNRKLDEDILQSYISDVAEISAFAFVEEFANRNLEKTIFYLEKLFAEKTSAITIIRLLASYFNKLLVVKTNVENGSSLEIEMRNQNIFFKQENSFKKHLQIWKPKAINTLQFKLQELEIKCKNSNFDSETLLLSFVNFVLMKK